MYTGFIISYSSKDNGARDKKYRHTVVFILTFVRMLVN